MDFKKELLVEVGKINEVISNFLDGREFTKEDDFVVHYYNTIKKYILSGGKRLRPFLVIQAYKGLAENPTDDIYKPSLCVELLHNASLIHDDIIDQDDTRRGNPSFHYIFQNYYRSHNYQFASPRHFGMTMGILGGDSTFFIGLESLQSSFPAALNEKAIALYCRAFHEICDGVLMEMNFVQLPDVNEKQYMKMISLKTAALIEKALLIGGTYAKASQDQMGLLSSYAINLGNAFQIKDDLLGSFGDESKTGKPSDGDIKEGKKTLLLLKSIEKASPDELGFLKQKLGAKDMTENDVEKVREIFTSSGAVDYSENMIEHYSTEAIKAINSLGDSLKPAQASIFKALVDFNLHREK